MTTNIEKELSQLGQELRSKRTDVLEAHKQVALKASLKAFDESSVGSIVGENEGAVWQDLSQAIFSVRSLVPLMLMAFALAFVLRGEGGESLSEPQRVAKVLVEDDDALDIALAYSELETSFAFSNDEETGLYVSSDDYSLVFDLSDIDEMEDNYDDESEEILEFL